MIDRADNIRNIKAAALVPQHKPFYQMHRISEKRRQRLLRLLEDKTDTGLDKWFEYNCLEYDPICTNCAMEAMWLLKPEYAVLWRASQAHILPKRKDQFPSLATNSDNHIVLFPSFGGFLCGCHNQYDASWLSASKMNIWPVVTEIFKDKLYPLIPDHEKKNIPEQLIITLLCRPNN